MSRYLPTPVVWQCVNTRAQVPGTMVNLAPGPYRVPGYPFSWPLWSINRGLRDEETFTINFLILIQHSHYTIVSTGRMNQEKRGTTLDFLMKVIIVVCTLVKVYNMKKKQGWSLPSYQSPRYIFKYILCWCKHFCTPVYIPSKSILTIFQSLELAIFPLKKRQTRYNLGFPDL